MKATNIIKNNIINLFMVSVLAGYLLYIIKGIAKMDIFG